MEEEEFDTEADYFESSAPWQNDICSQVGQLAFSEVQVNLEDTWSQGPEYLVEAFMVHIDEKRFCWNYDPVITTIVETNYTNLG